MTTDTEFETWVRSQLHVIADGVTPRPDPYGRLLRRRRLGWLRLGVLTGVAATAVAGGVVAVAPVGSPEPTPTSTPTFQGELRWAASIIDAPARGSLAADEAFTADLANRIEQRSRDGEHPMFEDLNGRPMGEVEARVVFAEDIDDTRLVVLTLQRPSLTSAYQRYGVTRLLWLTGPRGASADELARADTAPGGRGEYQTTEVSPFAYLEVSRPSRIRLGLAPPQCEVSTAPSEDLATWRVEPTRSWILRTVAEFRPEYLRVTCDGVVREEWPVARPEITRADVTAALADAPGEPRRDQVEGALRHMTAQYRSELLTLPRVLWAGTVAHNEEYESIATSAGPLHYDPYHPEVTLLAAPAARGGWIGFLDIDIDPRPGSLMNAGVSPFFTTADDPGAPGAMLGLRVRGWNPMVFVLAPEGAARVRLVAPDGTVLDEGAVTQRALFLSLPPETSAAVDIRVEAFDAAGAVIASAEVGSTGGVESHHIRDWR